MSTILLKDHFEENQFEGRRADGRRLLKWNAVPTITAFEIDWRKSLIAHESDYGGWLEALSTWSFQCSHTR